MIGIAAVVGGMSIFAANIWIRSAADARVAEMKPAPEPRKPQATFDTIVVAKVPLRYGTELERSQLAEIPWSRKSLPEGAFGSIDAALSKGSRVVLSAIGANEPVLLSKLSGPDGRATLSNRLTPGMRAVTIRTDEIAGVGGFVTPGDRVDVVLTRDVGEVDEVSANASGAAGSTIATEIVVSNARVLSVGQGADESATTPRVVNSVTIEVTPEGAQKVSLARNVGTLSLTLRSAGESGGGAEGLTTISAFGGSITSRAGESAGTLFAADDQAPRFETVVVTRGMTKPESYKVVAPNGEDGDGTAQE